MKVTVVPCQYQHNSKNYVARHWPSMRHRWRKQTISSQCLDDFHLERIIIRTHQVEIRESPHLIWQFQSWMHECIFCTRPVYHVINPDCLSISRHNSRVTVTAAMLVKKKSPDASEISPDRCLVSNSLVALVYWWECTSFSSRAALSRLRFVSTTSVSSTPLKSTCSSNLLHTCLPLEPDDHAQEGSVRLRPTNVLLQWRFFELLCVGTWTHTVLPVRENVFELEFKDVFDSSLCFGVRSRLPRKRWLPSLAQSALK